MSGHSLGEITALVAAGALDAPDGLRLVAARGRLMDEASEGGMLAVRVRERAPVEEVAAETGLALANDNAPDQLVLSGAGRLLAVGLILGVALTAAADRFFRGVLFGVSAVDGRALAAAAATLAIVSLLAVAGPAFRAARVAPVDALKGE